MGRLKIQIHPLFFAAAVYYIIIGQIFLFLGSMVIILLHEVAHSFMAAYYGYKLKTIVLLPYGAMVSGNIKGLRIKDQAAVALAGPVCSFLVYFFIVALWWINPALYAFTDTLAYIALGIAVMNLLPAYPLDGGRILMSALQKKMSEQKSIFIAKICGYIVSFCLLIAAIIAFNLSALFVSIFIFVGTISNKAENSYQRMFTSNREKRLKNVGEIKRLAVSADTTVKKLISSMRRENLYEVALYDNNLKFLKTLTDEELEKICLSGDIYGRIGTII